jgi:hypothetical protein
MCDLCLSGMLQCLEPDMRLAYLLREVAEMDYDDVALVLEIEPDAAHQMVSCRVLIARHPPADRGDKATVSLHDGCGLGRRKARL